MSARSLQHRTANRAAAEDTVLLLLAGQYDADDDDDRTKMQTAVSVALRCAHMNAPATERTHTRTRHDHAIDHQWA